MALRTGNLLLDYHLLSFDTLDSTNEEAKRLARTGGAHGAVIWAKTQTQGRGRMDRQWDSLPGNLFVSMLLDPACDIAEAGQLSFVTALALRDALAPLLPEGTVIECKWPNDVLVNGKKIAGILSESFTPPNDPRLWVIVGAGVNIDAAPKEAQFPATCLKEEGVELISAKIVLARFIHHFVLRYNEWTKRGFLPIRREWQKQAWLKGEAVTIHLPQEEIHGTFKEIDQSGSLVLSLQNRRRQVIPAGDMTRMRQAITPPPPVSKRQKS